MQKENSEPNKHPFLHSLFVRIALILAVIVVTTSAALFFGIEHFITKQFNELQIERQSRLAEYVRQSVKDEKDRLQNITQLLVNDTELKNSTYYHLYLAGEQLHPQNAIEKIAKAFNLESIVLWNTNWELIAGHKNQNIAFISSLKSGVIKFGGIAWIVTTARMERDNVSFAYLQLATPLNHLLSKRFDLDDQIKVTVAKTLTLGKENRIAIDNSSEVYLDLVISDPVSIALSKVKILLSKILLISGFIMTLVFVFFLRWQLQPLSKLHHAAEALGTGDFTVQIEPKGSLEMTGLIIAFNHMASRLRQMRSMESQLRHQEQLSAIGRVAARVAHNINNPLTVIHNMAILIKGQDDKTQNREDIEIIIHHSLRAAHTVELLLKYGQPIHLQREAIDLPRLCKKIGDHWLYHNKTVPLSYINEEQRIEVFVDALQFEEVLENLLDNAHQAAPGRPIVLEFGLDAEAWVKVTDQGDGFTNEARQHLFEPFFTTKSKGNGLGLASSMAIIRAHGGNLILKNDVNGVIVIYLPLNQEQRSLDVNRCQNESP